MNVCPGRKSNPWPSELIATVPYSQSFYTVHKGFRFCEKPKWGKVLGVECRGSLVVPNAFTGLNISELKKQTQTTTSRRMNALNNVNNFKNGIDFAISKKQLFQIKLNVMCSTSELSIKQQIFLRFWYWSYNVSYLVIISIFPRFCC